MRRGLAVRVGAGCAHRGKRQPQIVGQGIGRAQRNDAQGGIAADHALQNVMRRAIASAGEDGVATFGDGLARLLGGFRLAARGLGGGLDSSLVQDGQCRLHVRQSPRMATARERVVEKNGLAH